MEQLTNDMIAAFKKARHQLRAVDHKLRQQLIDYMLSGRRTVTEIYLHFRIEQSVASQHLAVLRKAGVVSTEREGKFIYYRADSEKLTRLFEQANALIAV